MDERDDRVDKEVDELRRHFPYLTMAMRIVWEDHIKQVDVVSPCCICEPVAVDAEDKRESGAA